MNLHDITPLILAYNEAPNIRNCLDPLEWAADIVVVDSGSTDGTVELASDYARVRMHGRAFDTHARQWNYGLKETGIGTDWVLGLDADYRVSKPFVREMEKLEPTPAVSAYRAPFIYAVFGRKLRGGVYPPVAVLFRRTACNFVQDGHTHRLAVREGDTRFLNSALVHDDRKPFRRWLASQEKYMALEADKLASTPDSELGLADRLRKKIVFTPFLVFMYSLIAKRGILDGWAGIYYATQRMTAEAILSVKLVEKRLAPGAGRERLGAMEARGDHTGNQRLSR